MGIPVGWNIVRDEAKEKDVLRGDVTGTRSPIRRRARGRRSHASAFDTDALVDASTSRFAHVEHAPRLSHARTQLPRAPPVPALREGDALRSSERPLPALTPGFAPAGPRQEDGMLAILRRSAESNPPPHDYEPASLRWASGRRHAQDAFFAPHTVSHPPLRRVGHRRIADGPLPASSLRESWSPVSTLDGLGDRDRSNSVSSTESNLPWQTFLSTVVPDPVAPTAESSFASAAASASFTASSSRASSSNSAAASDTTHLTVPSRRGSSAQANERCESSDEGASTASDTEDEASANPLSRRRMRPSLFADAPPPRRHGRSVEDAGNHARRYVRSYYADAPALYTPAAQDTEESFGTVEDDAPDALHVPEEEEEDEDAESRPATPDADAPAARPTERDQELREARSLLQRLAERRDVGEDFWASVGLTRFC